MLLSVLVHLIVGMAIKLLFCGPPLQLQRLGPKAMLYKMERESAVQMVAGGPPKAGDTFPDTDMYP